MIRINKIEIGKLYKHHNGGFAIKVIKILPSPIEELNIIIYASINDVVKCAIDEARFKESFSLANDY